MAGRTLTSQCWLSGCDVVICSMCCGLHRRVNRSQWVSHLISSSDISIIKEKLLGLAHACAHSSAILSIQETMSWDVPNLELPGNVGYGSTSGFATLLVSEQLCTNMRSWKFEERCAAILFGTTLVMAVYAPNSIKSLEINEACILSVINVLQEGRR